MSVVVVNVHQQFQQQMIVQNLLNKFNNKYIYIYNNSEISDEGRENNLLFILDTVKYKILVISKSGFMEELNLFNKIKEFIINYIGSRRSNYFFLKIRSKYNNYKFKFIFSNVNNKCYLFFKNTECRTKKERKYKTYTTYYIIKNELIIPPPVYTPSLIDNTTQTNTSSEKTNTASENKTAYIKTISDIQTIFV
jgi:hypothetical protein